MRAFVALPVPEEAAAAISAAAARLHVGRIVPQDDLHLTLAFLDEQPQEVLAAFHDAFEMRSLNAAEIVFDGFNVFGGAKPRVVFAAVVPNPALKALRADVRSACRAAGITLPHERFRPHVTIARLDRIMSPDDADRLQRFLAAHAAAPLPGFTATTAALYRSLLRPEGPRYDVLASYTLAS